MQVRPQWEMRESTPQWETRESTQVPRTELGGLREGQVVHRRVYYVNSSYCDVKYSLRQAVKQ